MLNIKQADLIDGIIMKPMIKELFFKLKKLCSKLISFLALITFDLLAIGIAIIFAYLARDIILPLLSHSLFGDKLLTSTFFILWWYPLTFIFTLAYEKLYYKRLPFWTEVEYIIKAATLAFLITVGFIYISGLSVEISRVMVVIIWLISIFTIPVFRYIGKKSLLKLGVWSCPVIVIGNLETAEMLDGALKREETMGYRVIGLISTGDEDQVNISQAKKLTPFSNLGPIKDAEKAITLSGIEDLIIADPSLRTQHLVELTNRFQPLVNNVIIVPDLFGISLNGIDMAYLFEEQAILLQIKNRLKSSLNKAVKRVFDVLFGMIFILLSLPIFLLATIAIKVDTKGSALFIQDRIGQGGKTFSALKFRTMYQDADHILEDYLASSSEARQEWEEYNKLRSYDPRVTKTGLFLRRFSLDELPQLFNVLKGEMSLVGPRPYMPREEEQIGIYARDIYVTKPGLTGLWQVSGRNDLSFYSRLKLDSWYVRNWSLWLDIVLLLKTFRVVTRTDGAY